MPTSVFLSVLVGVVGGPLPVLLWVAEVVEDLGDVIGDVSQVAAVHAQGQLDRRLDVVVRDLGRRPRSVERRRHSAAGSAGSGPGW